MGIQRMGYVAFKTNGSMSAPGVVVIKVEEIASIFQEDDAHSTSIVLTNSIGYQVDGSVGEIIAHITKSRWQTIAGALMLLRGDT